MTHTYAELAISQAAHTEIKAALLQAGYGHAIEGDAIDMHGLALVAQYPDSAAQPPAARPAPADMFWNNDAAEQCHASIDDLLNNEWGTGSLEVGAEFEVQQAVRLPNVMIRVTAISEDDDEIMYEEIGKTAK